MHLPIYNWFDDLAVEEEVGKIKTTLNSVATDFAGTRKTSSLKPETNTVIKFLDHFDEKLNIEKRWICAGRIHGDLHQKNLIVQYIDYTNQDSTISGVDWSTRYPAITDSINTIAIEYKYKGITTEGEGKRQCLIIDHWMMDFASLEVFSAAVFFHRSYLLE